MAIKWRKQDINKLQNYVRKFNAAITRLEKKTPELKDSGVFPERLIVGELKYKIINRADFNRELKKIDRFFKPKARDIIKDESGFYTTRWQQREIKYLEQRVNRQRKKFINDYKIPKKEQAFLGVEEIDLMKERKRVVSKALKGPAEDTMYAMQEWYNLLYNIERQSSADYLTGTFAKMRNAYFKAIDEHMPEDKAKELKEFLNKNSVSGADIVYAISINDIVDFEYMYSTEEEAAKAEVMLDRWKGLLPRVKNFNKNR